MDQPNHTNGDTMTTFIVQDKQNGVLAPLRYVVQQLSFLTIAAWCFRSIRIHAGHPFGLTVREFEQLTRQSPKGYCVADTDLRTFLDDNIQIVDGEIDAIAEDGMKLLKIVCEDATQWEINITSSELAQEMERRGFRRQTE